MFNVCTLMTMSAKNNTNTSQQEDGVLQKNREEGHNLFVFLHMRFFSQSEKLHSCLREPIRNTCPTSTMQKGFAFWTGEEV